MVCTTSLTELSWDGKVPFSVGCRVAKACSMQDTSKLKDPSPFPPTPSQKDSGSKITIGLFY